MSSGEGAEETTKDAGDIAALFKTGKPSDEPGEVGPGTAESSYARDIVPECVDCYLEGGAHS